MRRLVWMTAVICLALPRAGLAQVGGGQLMGLVTDAAGAAVPGATVTATSTTTNAARHTVSSSAGIYAIAGLSPGSYRLDVALNGFRTERREGIRLETGETIRLDVQLAVGEVAETISVSADAPMTRATASLGQVIYLGEGDGAPAERPELHHPGHARARGGVAPGLPAAAHQRRTAAHQRVPLRRDFGAAAGAWTGRDSSRSSTPSRSSKSRPTARRPSSAVSTAAS